MTLIIVTSLLDTIDASDGVVTLREAIQAANTDAAAGDAPPGSGNDVITFDASLKGQTINTAGTLTLASALTIDGDLDNDGVADITIDGDSTSNVLHLNSTAVVTIDGLTLTGGGGSILNGGGILSEQGDLTVKNSVITGNRAGVQGGGIASISGNLTVINTTVSGNYSYLTGGGISFEDAGSKTLTIVNSTISGNSSFIKGGGLYIAPTASGSSLTNVTVTGNSAREQAGILVSGPLTITSSTIVGNIATDVGNPTGGIGSVGSAITLTNTVVAHNTGPDLEGSFTSGGHNFIGDGGLGAFVDGVNGDQVGTSGAPLDPMLGALANNGGLVQTMAPLAGSPLIDAGRNGALPIDTLDLDGDGNTTERLPLDASGRVRIENAVVDIGAFETSYNNAPTITIEGHLDLVTANGIGDDFGVLIGDGLGGFGSSTNTEAGDGPNDIALADLDGDGALDVVVVNSVDDNIIVLLGDGRGGFGAPTIYASGVRPTSLALADLNGDGNLDIIKTNLANSVGVLLGDGLGGFGAETQFAVGAERSRSQLQTSTATAISTPSQPTIWATRLASSWGTAAAALHPRRILRSAMVPRASRLGTSTATASSTSWLPITLAAA